jgi:hypothetical protein
LFLGERSETTGGAQARKLKLLWPSKSGIAPVQYRCNTSSR